MPVKSAIGQVTDAWRQVFLPSACLACRAIVDDGFCASCRGTVRDATDEDDGAVALFEYGGALATAIRSAKFGPDFAVAKGLARFFAESARDRADALALFADVDAVSYVPAPLRRRLRRRFDFPALLATALGREFAIPVVDALTVKRYARSHAGGHRDDVVEGRFKCLDGVRASPILLVDDVVTTGATLSAAQTALGVSSAGKALTLARTPLMRARQTTPARGP